MSKRRFWMTRSIAGLSIVILSWWLGHHWALTVGLIIAYLISSLLLEWFETKINRKES